MHQLGLVVHPHLGGGQGGRVILVAVAMGGGGVRGQTADSGTRGCVPLALHT